MATKARPAHKPGQATSDIIVNVNMKIPETPNIKGSRRLAREKAMQLLSAQEISDVPWKENFYHIFSVEYRTTEPEYPNRLMSEEEVEQLEADFIIEWDEENKQFALTLLSSVTEYDQYTTELIERFSQNWDIGRIAHVDRVVLKLAITELLSFPEIPPKVTINEAIEIVKKYSTEKSGIFVNGILDAVLVELKSEGKLVKTGRGLLDINLGKK